MSIRWTHAVSVACLIWLGLLVPPSGAVAQEDGLAARLGLTEYEWVGRKEVCRAMSLERGKGYDLTASTNGSRLWFHSALTLARWARERGDGGAPLFIPQEEYYQGYRCVTGLADEQVPEFIRIAREYQQHTLVEHRRSRVVDEFATEDPPEDALAVKTWWPDGVGAAERYTLIDTLSDPNLEVVNEREVRYRILDYGDFVLIDDVSGIRGRPSSGVLGLLFKVLGTATVQWSRMGISDRNEQVVRANGKKIFAKTSVVTVAPSGVGAPLPDHRPDLEDLAHRMARPLKVAYPPWPF